MARRRRRPAALPPARRLGLGRQALAGLQHDPRALGPRELRRRRPLDRPGLGDRPRYPAETPEQALAAARAFWLDPRLEPETVDVAARVRARSSSRPPTTASTPQYRREQRAQTARAAPERPPSSHRRLGRLPDQLMPDSTSSACGCAGFSRSELLRGGAAATAGRGLRAIEAGMPLPAGTGLSRRSFLSRAERARARRVRRRRARPARARGRDRRRRGRRRGARARLDLLLRRHGLAVAARAGRRPALRGAARHARAAAPTPSFAFGEDSRLRWHPAAAPLRDLHAAGKLSVIPAIGYDDPNQSHFTSRHYWEVGALDPAGRVGWLGRYLDRHGVADNPLQGLSLDYTLAPVAGDLRRARRRRLRARVLRPVDARRLGRRAVRRRRLALGRARARSRPPTRSSRPPAARPA